MTIWSVWLLLKVTLVKTVATQLFGHRMKQNACAHSGHSRIRVYAWSLGLFSVIFTRKEVRPADNEREVELARGAARAPLPFNRHVATIYCGN